MMHRWSRGLAVASSLLLASLVTALAPAAAQAQQPAPHTDAACLQCHEGQGAVAATKHGAKSDPKTPYGSGQGCTACHGNNPNHASNPTNNPQPNRFGPKVPAGAQSEVCLTCHAGNRHLTFWEAGRHKKNDVSCNDCHSIHAPPTVGSNISLTKRDPSITPFVTTVRQLEYETCSRCHMQIRSQLFKPSHHPIIEGKLKCSDCHNPHGALSHAMVKDESINQLCTSCHADKRGPYMWEHPPVEQNCLSCHQSHGSSHNSLLSEKVPNLCQDCHDWSRHPGTAYSGKEGFQGNQNTRFVARACLNCHNSIHGSNAPANRGKVFTR